MSVKRHTSEALEEYRRALRAYKALPAEGKSRDMLLIVLAKVVSINGPNVAVKEVGTNEDYTVGLRKKFTLTKYHHGHAEVAARPGAYVLIEKEKAPYKGREQGLELVGILSDDEAAAALKLLGDELVGDDFFTRAGGRRNRKTRRNTRRSH